MAYLEQFVRTNPFLQELSIALKDLKQGSNEISFIPTNAVVLNVDLEIKQAGNGTAKLGIKDDDNLFLDNVNLATIQNNLSSVRLSSGEKTHIITLDLTEAPAQDSKGEIIFRMFWFGNEYRMLDLKTRD